MDNKGASGVQHGGNHYTKQPIQTWDYITANNFTYLEGNVIKYISRHRNKGGLEDLKKARHYIDKIIEVMYTKAVRASTTTDPRKEAIEETIEDVLGKYCHTGTCED
tara:strand:+ start:213 stop:533 length:321 start_codon:yes stop_codon:yes gene_type:complete